MSDDDEIAASLSSAATYKGWVTRNADDLDTLSETLANNPSLDAIDMVRKKYAALTKAADEASERYNRAIVLEKNKARVDQYIARQAEMEQTLTESQTKMLRAIHEAETAMRPQVPVVVGGGPAGGARPGRLQEGLKPPMLTLAAPPEEVTLWKKKFKTYFRRSQVSDWTEMEDQHNVFFCAVDTEVGSRVTRHARYGLARPVLQQQPATGDSLEEILDLIFLDEWPLFGRQLQFFNMKQEDGQTADEFVSLLEDRAREGNVATMRFEEILKYRMLTGVREEGLLKEWRRLENPTLADMKRTLRIYTAGKKQEKATKKNAARAARAQNREQNKDGRDGRSQSRARVGGRPVPDEWKDKCLRCGSSTHFVAKCDKKREDTSCTSCGSIGHLANVCLKSKDKKQGGNKARTTTDTSEEETDAEEEYKARKLIVSMCRKQLAKRGEVCTCTKQSVEKGANKATPLFTLKCFVDTKRSGRRAFRVEATPDTGATRTVISADLVEEMDMETKHTSAKLYSAKEGEQMECSRKVRFRAKAPGGSSVAINALVSRDLHSEILVSWHDLVALRILPDSFPSVLCNEDKTTTTGDGRAATAVAHDDVEKLQEDFQDVLRDELNEDMKVKGEPMKIRFKKGVQVVPVKRLTVRQSRFFMKAAEDELLEKLMKAGVLGRLDENTTTEWLSRGHFVLKPDGKRVRLVTDFIDLNRYIDRPVHPFPKPDAVFKSILSGSKWFAKLDALHGYFQIPLDEESQLLTAFLLPQGRFYYKVAPMGLNPSGDWWCQKSDEALSGLQGVVKMVDDVLVQADTKEELFTRIRAVLERCRQHGIVMSKSKLEVGQRVKFAGHVVSHEGVSADPDKLVAISNFPTPKSETELRSFLGMANQLSTYLPDLAQSTEELRHLLGKGKAWTWLPEHQKAFDRSKQILVSPTVVSYFDPSLPPTILTDASRSGLGFVLVQHDAEGQMHIISCGSRSLNSAESRYAPVELECLGIAYAAEKLDFYIRGSPVPFKVVTDHRPLIGVFKKPLSETPNHRLQRLRLKMVGLNMYVEWQAGKHNLIADALSRAPVFPAAPLSPEDEVEEEFFVRCVTEHAVREGGLEWMCGLAQEDAAYQAMVAAKRENVPANSLPLTHPARQMKGIWDHISLKTVGQATMLVYDACRLIVPTAARRKIVDLLHMPHAGLVKTRKAASQLYYWPGMSAAIADKINTCDVCMSMRPSKPLAPLTEDVKVDQPMDSVSMDLFEVGNADYLLMVDRFSGFPWVHKVSRTDSRSCLNQIKKWFYMWGFPATIRSDGGPQFVSKNFRIFCWDHDILHELSSAYNPSSNGHAEAAVKSCKNLLIKCIKEKEDYWAALHEFRNMPRADGFSPAQLMFSRRMRSALPVLPEARRYIDVQEGRQAREQTLQQARDRTVTRPKAEEFRPGDLVRVQDPVSKKWTGRAEVLSRRFEDEGTSYIILMDGKEKKRNARFLHRWQDCHENEGGKMQHNADSDASAPHSGCDISDRIDEQTSEVRRSERLKAKKKVRYA